MSRLGRIAGLTMRAGVGVLGALLGLAGLIGTSELSAVLPAAAASGPNAIATSPVTSSGQLERVSGSGWDDVGGVVTVQICGQDAVNLTSDCDEANTYDAAIRPGGTFFGALYVQVPQTPCPCVIYVTSQSGESSKIPIQIVGAPVEPIVPQINPLGPLALNGTLDTPTSVTSWFGGPKNVTLLLHVKNISGVSLPSAVVSVRVGRGGSALDFVAGKTLATLPVGASRVVHIPLTIPAVTYGRYTLLVETAVDGTTVTTKVQTSSWPWAWLVIAIQLFLIVLVLILRRVRRAGESQTPSGATGSPVTPPPGVHPEFVN
jgi:hypothetical protein